jgi:Ca-activated chloride channel homolog
MTRPELDSAAELAGAMLLPHDAALPPVPLEQTTIILDVVGPLATARVSQRFRNSHTAPLDALYVFPLPSEAAVTGFELQVGTRLITGELRPHDQAREAFTAAAQRGADAALLSRQRPNLFSIELANLQPDEVVEARLSFFSQVPFDDGWFNLAVPTVVLPRYFPAGAPTGPEQGAVPLLPAGAPGHRLSLQISLDVGQRSELDARGFAYTIREERGRTLVSLSDAAAVPDRDAVLRYRPAGEGYSAAGFAYRAAERPGAALIMLTPRALPSPSEVLPRELLFVFDRSGSMGGESIVQARNALRACLRALNPADTFNIFPFDNVVEQLAPAPLPFTQQSVDAADHFIATIDARGGTEIAGALGAALAQPRDPARLRVIVFLTDGAVGNEDQVLRSLAGQLNEARVYAFGVGSAVNRFLLDRLAAIGRGSAEYILHGEPIEPAVQRFQRRAALPLLRDISVDWGGASVSAGLPDPLPDLYAGQPLVLLARYSGSHDQHTRVTIRGRTSQGSYSEQIALELPAATPDRSGAWAALPQLWARARLQVLEDEARLNRQRSESLNAEAAALAIEYGLLSAHTAFVAVEEAPADATGRRAEQRIIVPVHLPAGTRREAFESDPGLLGGGMAYRLAAMAPSPAPRSARSGSKMGKIFDALLGGAAPSAADTSSDSFSATPAVPGLAYTPPTHEQTPAASPAARRSAALRFLARTQAVNGAWADDETATALAALAFAQAGHTTHSGDFRPQLTRTAAWLNSRTPASELVSLALRALAGDFAALSAIAAAQSSVRTAGLDRARLTQLQRLGGDSDGAVLPANAAPNLPGPEPFVLSAALALLI